MAEAVGTGEFSITHEPSTADLSELVDASIDRRRRTSRRQAIIVYGGKIAAVVVFLAAWQIASVTGLLPHAQIFYSKPTAIATFLVDNRSTLLQQSLATGEAALWGFVIGTVLGVISGILLGRLRMLDSILDPIINVLNGLPRIALAPLFLLWFGITIEAKIFLAVSIVYFVVLLNVRAGVRSVDDELQTVAKLMGAPPWKVITSVVLPASAPVLFGTLRIAIAFAVLGVIASEMISATKGLGVALITYGQVLDASGVFSVLVILAVFIAVLNGVIRFFETRLLSWQHGS